MSDFVVVYRPEWRQAFTSEAAAIRAALGATVGDVQHIGSTSVPGMLAKPIIDMIAAVDDLDAARGAADLLATLGYERRPHRTDAVLYVRPARTLHLTTTDSGLWRERLTFRDALRREAALREEYRVLKLRLLDGSDGAGYSARDKRSFVRRVLEQNGVALRDGLHADGRRSA